MDAKRLNGYSLEQITIVGPEVNLLWVYITAPICAVICLIIIICVCRRLKKQRQIKQEVEKERAAGLTPQWGQSISRKFSESSGKKSQDGGDIGFDSVSNNSFKLNE